jgi:hypothetical protein
MRTALLLGLVSLAARVSAQGPQPSQGPDRLTVEEYAQGLERIAPLLEAGQVEEAREEARELLRAEVDYAGEAVGTDGTVLDGVVTSRGGGEAWARAQAARARRLAGVLRTMPSGAAGVTDVHPEVLARLAPGEDVSKGGKVGLARLEVKTPSISDRFGEALLAAYDWLTGVIRKVVDWLARFRPRRTGSDPESGGTAAAAIAVVALVAAVLAVLAYRALRRGGRGGVEVESDRVLASVRDEDPLSREAGEWEKHARDLAAAGRWREAVRAWYHAVLVCLFQHGLLHHQKGSTNWEYAARLAPDNAWRPDFLDLTRLFDREWYGRPASDAEAVRACSAGARAILRAVRGAGEAA